MLEILLIIGKYALLCLGGGLVGLIIFVTLANIQK